MGFNSFKDYITETYVNALQKDEELKHKYKDQVWDILQKSYASIGGVKGSGFGSPEDMINIPFWKMNIVNGRVVAVVMYKDKGGRKLVALGNDGTGRGKDVIGDALKNELGRSIMEVSKSTLGKFLKVTPENIVKQFVKTPEQADKILVKDELTYVKNMEASEIPTDGLVTLKRYPYIREFAYIRDIGGEPHFKLMVGTEGNKIK